MKNVISADQSYVIFNINGAQRLDDLPSLEWTKKAQATTYPVVIETKRKYGMHVARTDLLY